uniref:Uncharacterized protein n=1 Tax=Vitis vinifera TaxID=29760 RepID=F6GWS9_VITVI
MGLMGLERWEVMVGWVPAAGSECDRWQRCAFGRVPQEARRREEVRLTSTKLDESGSSWFDANR